MPDWETSAQTAAKWRAWHRGDERKHTPKKSSRDQERPGEAGHRKIGRSRSARGLCRGMVSRVQGKYHFNYFSAHATGVGRYERVENAGTLQSCPFAISSPVIVLMPVHSGGRVARLCPLVNSTVYCWGRVLSAVGCFCGVCTLLMSSCGLRKSFLCSCQRQHT